MIPKIIHFVWIGDELPGWAERNIAEFRCLNPDHQVLLHGEEAVLPKYAGLCAAADHPSSKSDLVRLSVLQEHGGWYFDVDYWPLRPLADVERAFCLDGSRLFAARMHNPRIGNGVLAAAPGCPALAELERMVAEIEMRGWRTEFGPQLVTRLAKEHPELARVASWPWFNGVEPEWAGRLYRRVRGGDRRLLCGWIPETGGQVPFAFHLWAHTHGDRIEQPVGNAVCTVGDGDRSVAIVVFRAKSDPRADRPFQAIAEACASLGFRAEIIEAGVERQLDACGDIPEAVFVWNGMNATARSAVADAARCGAKVIYLEHGFFDRNAHFQADHEGFLHRASWRRRILAGEQPPEGAAERLARFTPDGIRQRRGAGHYVLVLGQVPSDTQLLDSELQGPVPLESAVGKAMPSGVQVYFRPHPRCSHVKPHRRHRALPRLSEANEVRDYVSSMHGSGLAEALAGAQFVITINSNAITEALIAGVPCLAFGPSIGIDAGAVHPTRMTTLAQDIREMLGGWRPAPERVRCYLEWLAARQWSIEEFRDPQVVAALLDAAGLRLPEPVEAAR